MAHLDVAGLERCLDGRSEKIQFLNTLYSVFFEKSVDWLKQSEGAQIRGFVELLQSRDSKGSVALFRLTGHFNEQSPTTFKGGFHRATGSIYMDIARIPRDEWLILFVHELLHSLDGQLYLASGEYSKVDRVKRIARWAKQHQDPRSLPEDSQAELEAWIEAGLGRGVWAEYRAWWARLAMYREGLGSGLWRNIAWLDAAVGTFANQRQAQERLYDYLSSRSSRPTEGIFSLPFVQNGLEQVLSRYGQGKKLPPLGQFGGFSW